MILLFERDILSITNSPETVNIAATIPLSIAATFRVVNKLSAIVDATSESCIHLSCGKTDGVGGFNPIVFDKSIKL